MASPLDSIGNTSTLGGVLVGAAMATLGSFVASWYERFLLRREREQDAALVFGELLRTLALQVSVLKTTHDRGEPFGPITVRMARGIRREVDVYDRNRERLFMVRDETLRPRATTLMARFSFAVDRVLENTEALASAASEDERQDLRLGREQAYVFLLECADEMPPMVRRFATLAKTHLADLDLEAVGLSSVRILDLDLGTANPDDL